MRGKLVLAVVLTAWATAGFVAAAADEGPAATLAAQLGVKRGICVLLDDKQCRAALELARQTDLILYVQLANSADVAAACGTADAAGLYGTRIFVEKGTPARIALADNLADAVVAPAEAAVKGEILRVLRPEGKAIVGPQQWTKPFPEGVDDWSHHYHGPDNNPQSADRLARAPLLTQFFVEPRYAPAPQAAVASGGRLFMAFGHVAWHQREEPWLDTLAAVNGFNGTLLWKRPLPTGFMVDRSTMIATPTTLYLADDKSCKLLDAATGEPKGEIAPPPALTGGTFWKWMALEGGVLYALIGEDESPDTVARWRSTTHGWPWGGISQGYNAQQYRWGFARTLLAIDPQTKQVLWKHREEPPIDSRSLCLKNGRIYCCNFGHYLACLDAKTGKDLWRRTADKDAEVFQAIGPYRPGHGYIGGWKSTVYLKCTEKALYFVGPQVEWVTALSAADGRVLWKHPAKDLHLVIRDDGVYATGPQNSQDQTVKLDALTGQVLARYPGVSRRACTRTTGTADSIFFRGHEGSGRLDVASGKMQWISTVRPSCHVGVVVAAGHLYWVPWACDCNLQMFGLLGCAPAGTFDFDQPAKPAERLERDERSIAEVAKFAVAAADWPTYRGDNARRAQSQATVPEKVKLLWQVAPKANVEPTAPVAAGGLVFVAGTDGVVRAFEADSGKPRWTAYTGGAVLFPPAVADGRALVGSGDGWVYAFEAATGRLLWRFRAAPVERKINFYGSLRSTWPVASGVLVDKGTAYFAAGITDYDGTHVYALETATGEIRWQNNTAGHLDGDGRRGVGCQGEMLLDDGRLCLAGGNTVGLATFDAATGRCLTERPTGTGAKAPRGRELALANGTVTVSGQPLYSRPESPVFDNAMKWIEVAVSAKNARLSFSQRKSGDGSGGVLAARSPADGRELWSQPLPAEPVRWGLAVDAQGRVIATLRDGRVLCFGN